MIRIDTIIFHFFYCTYFQCGAYVKWRLFWLCEALAFVSGKDKCAWMCGGFPFSFLSLCSKNPLSICRLFCLFTM